MLKKIWVKKSLAALIVLAFVVTLLPVGSNAVQAANNDAPKYVFYFIGDGLGATQRQAAEYYLQEISGDKNRRLLMNQFPVAGINTTYSTDSLVTDSAAAGTALATGYKTNNGVISKLPDGTDVKTLMEAAEENNMATGLISTTRITHATPATFASHNINRNNENEIAMDYLDSGVDYIAGGGYRHFVPQKGELKSKRKDSWDVMNQFYAGGYRLFLTEDETESFRNYQPVGQEKVIALFTNSHMPYEVDRLNNDNVPSLAELTEKGIEVLSAYNKGFFMMVEGGRIDHACHANDAKGSIMDTLALDDAIKEAYEFYQNHPKETLIVVVGDHETGGMALGFGLNYFLKMNELVDVKASVEDILQGKYTGNRSAFFEYIENTFSLDNLTANERTEIEKAMDIVDKGLDTDVYGGYDPVAIATTHVVSERANMYWTTYAHSGTAIPMSAIGKGAEAFGGYKDNTEIAKAMASLMGFQLTK